MFVFLFFVNISASATKFSLLRFNVRCLGEMSEIKKNGESKCGGKVASKR